jgi:phosphoribosylformylglycinamidine cyclo-ligase
LPQAGAVWGGGETPTLKGIVSPTTIVLAGSAIGKIAPKGLRITGDVRDGDAIIFLARPACRPTAFPSAG